MIRKLTKASYTVELSLLMPVILLVIFSTVYLCFYIHNRTYLTAASYEAALLGSFENNMEEEKRAELARRRIKARAGVGLFGAENMDCQVTGGNDLIVTTDSDTIHSYGGLSWHLHTKGESKVVEPVAFIRRFRSLGDLVDNP